jgi:hypothetical protein
MSPKYFKVQMCVRIFRHLMKFDLCQVGLTGPTRAYVRRRFAAVVL